jgi:hypothetical protein
MNKIDSKRFYNTYSGHDVTDLKTIHHIFNNKKFIFLAGDSSLDNKHWIYKTKRVDGIYEKVLNPPLAKTDICFGLTNYYRN